LGIDDCSVLHRHENHTTTSETYALATFLLRSIQLLDTSIIVHARQLIRPPVSDPGSKHNNTTGHLEQLGNPSESKTSPSNIDEKLYPASLSTNDNHILVPG
jgi:hypothetical protein